MSSCTTCPKCGPNLFAHNENSAYVMPHVTAHAVMSCVHCAACARRQVGCPYVYVAHQKLLMDMPFMPTEQYLSIINCLTFWHPKYKICKPERAGKDSHCHAQ